MLTQKDIDNVKEAYGIAWIDALKYGNEVHRILSIPDLMDMRDARNLLNKTVCSAIVACDDWKTSMTMSANLIARYNSMLMRG